MCDFFLLPIPNSLLSFLLKLFSFVKSLLQRVLYFFPSSYTFFCDGKRGRLSVCFFISHLLQRCYRDTVAADNRWWLHARINYCVLKVWKTVVLLLFNQKISIWNRVKLFWLSAPFLSDHAGYVYVID